MIIGRIKREWLGRISLEEAFRLLTKPFSEWAIVVVADYGNTTQNVIIDRVSSPVFTDDITSFQKDMESALQKYTHGTSRTYYDDFCNFRVAIVKAGFREYTPTAGRIIDIAA